MPSFQPSPISATMDQGGSVSPSDAAEAQVNLVEPTLMEPPAAEHDMVSKPLFRWQAAVALFCIRYVEST